MRSQITPDPNGGWVNRATGQHFTLSDTPSPAGAGFLVADLLGHENGGFLVWSTNLLLHVEASATTTFIDADGSFAPTQNIGDYWVSPAQLANLADQNYAGSRVMHVPYPFDGRTYRGVLIQTQSGDGWSQNTYDADTGLLLSSSSTTAGGSVLTLDPGNTITAGAGNTMLTYGRLMSMRQTSLPGAGEAYPQSLRGLRRLVYSGSNGVIIAGSDIQVPPSPLRIVYDIGDNRGSYLKARVTVSGLVGGDQPRERLIPAGIVGSLWMNPSFLERLDAGRVLDSDAVTTVRTVVTERRKDIVVLATETSLGRQAYGYHLHSGLLLRGELRQQLGPGTTILTAQLASTQ